MREITQTQKGKPVSRAQLPRLLYKLDGSALNKLIERSFGVRIQYHQSRKWIAIDGKALRGTLDAHHFNPVTTAQIHQAGGLYLTQVKENQALLLQQCKMLHTQFLPLAETSEHEKDHGHAPHTVPTCSPRNR